VLLVGDGPDRKRLEGLVGQHGVSAHVNFVGRAVQGELPAYYAACDVFALPCRTQRFGIDVEGLGIVLLEASATGKPVVAGDSGGAPDAVLDGHTGLVVGDDQATLANTLINLITDDTRASAMGQAGRQWVLDSWTWDTPASRLAAMLNGSDPDV
jgi:phosphatidyl-myo-inositol dimannoside synthase